MDYDFAADYSFGKNFPSTESVNYFTEFKPIEYGSGFSLGGTLAPEIPKWTLSDGTPNNTLDVTYPEQTPTGNTFQGFLSGVSATANGFLDTVGKVYSLKNQWESQKFGQDLQEGQLELQRAQLGANIEIAKNNTQAQRDIEIARAGVAVSDAQSQLRSSQGASVVTMPQAIPWGLVAVGGAVALFFTARKGKAS